MRVRVRARVRVRVRVRVLGLGLGSITLTLTTLGSTLDSDTLDCLRKCGCEGSAVAGGQQLVWQGVLSSVNKGMSATEEPTFCAFTITYEAEI